MKLNIRKKLLMLLHWLCSLMICVAFALCVIVPDLRDQLISKAEGAMGPVGARIAGIALLALYAALCVAQLFIIINRQKRVERGFISVGSNDKGRVRIAVSAVEQMVRQSVRNIDGITEMKVDVDGMDDAIVIGVNCGVAVQSVEITINAVSGKGDPARRRLLSRGKPEAGMPTPEFGQNAVESGNGTDTVSDAAQTVPSAAPESIWNGAPTAQSVDEEKTPAFDPDKPYESEFAKDLAAMKAREAENEADEDDGE